MRAKEFLPETKLHGTYGKVDPELSNPLPGVFVQRDLRNTDPYLQYRYGLAMAGARAKAEHDIDFEQESPWAENLVLIPYTTADEDTIHMADKMMGVTATRLTGSKSKETNVNAVSTVANIKRNKYGV